MAASETVLSVVQGEVVGFVANNRALCCLGDGCDSSGLYSHHL
jgi:hypothetical protein